MNYGAKEIVWLRGLLKEMKYEQEGPTKMLCDNQSAVKLAYNPVFHKRTKHIMVKFLYLVEQLTNDELILEYIITTKNLADMFTKAEKINHFIVNRSKLNMELRSRKRKAGSEV